MSHISGFYCVLSEEHKYMKPSGGTVAAFVDTHKTFIITCLPVE